VNVSPQAARSAIPLPRMQTRSPCSGFTVSRNPCRTAARPNGRSAWAGYSTTTERVTKRSCCRYEGAAKRPHTAQTHATTPPSHPRPAGARFTWRSSSSKGPMVRWSSGAPASWVTRRGYHGRGFPAAATPLPRLKSPTLAYQTCQTALDQSRATRERRSVQSCRGPPPASAPRKTTRRRSKRTTR
jgi:hypothetical protein